MSATARCDQSANALSCLYNLWFRRRHPNGDDDDIAGSADASKEEPVDHAALLRAERRAAMDTLLIDVLRGDPATPDRRVIGSLGDRSHVAKSKGR